ncbi:MAG: hypothetical protein CM15mV11_2300 [Caudoviricetes sp.]|nr:MAG: hypothetical protein CM15mV11_2300 [Caudoviricetes sp.]
MSLKARRVAKRTTPDWDKDWSEGTGGVTMAL